MPSSGYTAITFTAGEQPTTAKWNLIGSNDSAFNLGTGLEDNTILDRHILTGNLNMAKASIPYKFRATKTSAQTPTAGTFTKIAYDTEQYDTGNNYDNVTNFRFVAPITAYYLVMGRMSIGTGAGQRFLLCLYKNGVIHSRGSDASSTNPQGSQYADMVKLTATDYIEMWCYAQVAAAFENTADIASFSATIQGSV